MASDLQCLSSYLQAIHTFLGEDNVKAIVNFALRYIADLDIPIKRYGFASVSICLHLIPLIHDKLKIQYFRGTFVEFRSGMLNISPIGRNCSQEERDAYEVYDLVGL